MPLAGGKKHPHGCGYLRFGLRDYISKILEYNKLPKIIFTTYCILKFFKCLMAFKPFPRFTSLIM